MTTYSLSSSPLLEPTGLPALNEDMTVYILKMLELQEVLNMRLTNRQIYSLTRLRPVWQDLYTHLLVENGLPRLSSTGQELSTPQLEVAIKQALRIQKAFSSSLMPQPKRCKLSSSNLPCVALRFTSGISWATQRLVAFRYHSDGSQMTQQLLHKGKHSEESIICNDAKGFALAVDDQNHPLVSIRRRDTQSEDRFHISILRFSSDSEPSSVLATVASSWRPLGTQGDLLALYDWSSAVIKIMNYNNASGLSVALNQQKHDSGFALEENKAVNLSFFSLGTQEVAIIVCRLHTIELYHLPLPLSVGSRTSHSIDSTAHHEWPWGTVHTLAISPDLNSFTSPKEVNLFVRFSAYFPWPAGMVHHYRLRASQSDASSFAFPPVHIRSISCTSDQFGECALAVGGYGRALWTDSTPRGRILMTTTLKDGGDPDSVKGIFRISRLVSSFVTAIAVDEPMGRVALGTEDGSVHLLDYDKTAEIA